MKRGRNPTREQKRLMSQLHMDVTKWLVKRDAVDNISFVHRDTGTVKKMYYGGEMR
jgi:hypothetical protein